MILQIKNLSATINQEKILKDISFIGLPHEVMAVIGPSGSGKTTLLRCIAGLEKYTGHILFDDKTIDNVPTPSRNIGLVTQDFSLFTHLTVYENIAYPLIMRKKSKSEINREIKKFLQKFNIESIQHKFPSAISGGEQQRTALARTLIYHPQILLLDEPFAHCDAILRFDLLHWLKKILASEKITTLFITHDIKEAKFIGQRLLFLHQGRLAAFATFNDLNNYHHPLIQSFLNKSL